MSVLAAFELCKRYGRRTVVDGLSISVERGDIYGFLGPNGAGKSTTLRMLMGLVRPSGGRVEQQGRQRPSAGLVVEGHRAHADIERAAGLDREVGRGRAIVAAAEDQDGQHHGGDGAHRGILL